MAYDEFLAERVRIELDAQRAAYEELNMMGGLCFMVDDKMCIGVIKDQLMARVDPEVYDDALSKPGASTMNFTGKPMKGFVFVSAEGVDMDNDLASWVELCLDFNPRAKSSKSP